MGDVQLQPTRCAICGTAGNAEQLYSANVNPEAFTPGTFSARRLPDRVHYRMVKCRSCGLVRSDPTADPAVLAKLYKASTFTYGDEVTSLRLTYGAYLGKLDELGVRKDALLEIGSGNGFFLEEALDRGYRSIRGVEPSSAAIAGASPRVRGSIVPDVMRPGLFEPDTFDVVCLFQVLDHIPDPAPFLDECRRVLKPGGLILCLNHDAEALSAQILGERSPIVDVEHTYLYSRRTIARLFSARGFRVRQTGTVRDTKTVAYLTWLFPLPGVAKGPLLDLVKKSPAGGLRLTVPLGNLYIVAQKP